MNFRKHKTPGRCPVRYCKNAPRNISDHPHSTQLCGSHAKELWRIRNPVHAAYDNLRASARKRRKVFTLTFKEFETLIKPTRYMDDKGKMRFCLHIDRKEVTLGYTFDNLQVTTCTENVVKGHAERPQRPVDEKLRRRT